MPARLLVFLIFCQICGGYLADVGQVVRRPVGRVVAGALRKYGQVVVGQVEAGQWPLPRITSSLLPLNPASL